MKKSKDLYEKYSSLMDLLKQPASKHSEEPAVKAGPVPVTMKGANRLDALIAQLCPDGVEYRKISDLFECKNGYTPSKSVSEYWENGTIPWFRMEDIRENGRILDDAIQHISSKALKKGRLFPANSIIVATSATIGEHCLITVPFLCNQRFTSLSVKDAYKKHINIKFIYYYCFIIDKLCLENTNISSFPSVDMAKFFDFKIPVPPLPVQEEIVRILDIFAELTAELTAELIKRKQQYQYYKDMLFRFYDKVNWVTLRDVCINISSGGTPLKSKTSYYNGNIPWLRTQEVRFCNIDKTEMTISDEGLKYSAAKWIPANCVIIAISGATAGRSAINRIPLTTNQHCCNLEINPKIALYKYVYYWVSSQYENIKAMGQGARDDLNVGLISGYKIPIPSLPEQQRIVSILDRFDTLCNDITSGLPAEIEARKKQYEYYRDRLLSFKEAGK